MRTSVCFTPALGMLFGKNIVPAPTAIKSLNHTIMPGRRGLRLPNYMAAARKICQSDCPCEEAPLSVTPQQINANSLEVALPFPSTAQPEATGAVVFVNQLTELNRILHDGAQLVVWRQPSLPKFTQVTC